MVRENVKMKVVGVDVGVEETTYAIVDVRGNVLAEDRFRTLDCVDVNSFVSTLSEKIVVLAESNGGFGEIRSVGISAPSANFDTGCIENAANLPWKGNIPLAAMLRDQLGLAVAVGNDAHVSALGEKAFGMAHGMHDFIVISLSHGGMGSCIFSNGHVHLGRNGFAGEIGHICIEENGRECGCGRKGCLEQYAALKGLLFTIRELLDSSDKPSLLRGDAELSIDTIVKACEQGDDIALEAMSLTARYLGLGLAVYTSLLNPAGIVLTGPMAHVGKWLAGPMRKAFEEHVFPNLRGKVRIVVSVLDDHERSLLGASALAWQVKEYSLFK